MISKLTNDTIDLNRLCNVFQRLLTPIFKWVSLIAWKEVCEKWASVFGLQAS